MAYSVGVDCPPNPDDPLTNSSEISEPVEVTDQRVDLLARVATPEPDAGGVPASSSAWSAIVSQEQSFVRSHMHNRYAEAPVFPAGDLH